MKKLLNKKGLTLIEIIVTLAVLGVVVSPLMSMFITSQKINTESRKEYEALLLAQKYMEEIKAMDTLDIDYVKGIDPGFIYNDGADNRGEFTINAAKDGYNLAINISGKVGADSTAEEIDFNGNERTIDSDDSITITNDLVKNIKRVLNEDNLTITISNTVSGHTVNLYIYSKPGEQYDVNKVVILTGKVNVIKNQASGPQPDNLLYDIVITVKKDGKEINTISGTTIFKKKPVKPI